MNPNLRSKILEAAADFNLLQGSADEVASAVQKLASTSVADASKMTSGFTGLKQVLAGLASSPLGMATVVAAGTAAVMALIDHFTVSYNEALSNARSSMQNYTSTQNELASLNSQLEINKQKLQELQALNSSGHLSASQANELSTLHAQNSALETQITAKKQLLELNGRQVNKSGEEYLQKADVSLASIYDADGMKYDEGSRQYDSHASSITDADAIQASIDKIAAYKKAIAQLENGSPSASSEKQIAQYQSAIDALETDMATRASNMSSIMAGMTDTTSQAYQDAAKALNAYTAHDLFGDILDDSSSSQIRDYFTKLAQAGALTEDTFKNLGISAADLGVQDLSTIVDYFNNIASAADNAADSIGSVDGSASGIAAAFQSENSGDDYVAMIDYLQQAKEMVDEGRWNTDDVKSVARMIGADPSDIQGSFNESYQNMMRYFTFDESGQVTRTGVDQFIEDYKALGDTFLTTAEAAEAMNMSTELFETIMGRAQEYTTDFDGLITSEEDPTDLLSNLLGKDSKDNNISISADTEEAQASLASLLAQMMGIPEEHTANFLANDELSPEAIEAMANISGIPEETLTNLAANNGASSVIGAVLEQLYGIPASTTSQLLANDNASSFADLVRSSVTSIPESWKSSLSAIDNASGIANTVASAIRGIPSFKKITVSAVASGISNIKTVAQNAVASVTGSKANGSAHSGGSWGIPHSGRALINELGSEIIVRNGRWFILNGGYPTLANLHAGDIIFNHKQSADILNHGYVTGSHARMVGNTFADGSVHGLSGRAFASGSKYQEQFDQIEILIERMESAFKKISDSVESLSYNLTVQNKQVDAAISKAKSSISAYQKAYDAYMKEANSVGLSSSWKKAVQNGNYKVSDITSESLKKKIDEYQKYYEKALDIQNDIADMQKELVDLAMQKLENIDSYFSNRFDYNDDFGYTTQISELKEALNSYTSELNRQISGGTILKYSNEWYDAQKQIAEYTQELLEAQWKKFEDNINYLSRVTDNFEDYLSLKEAAGTPLTEADYQKQLNLNNQSIEEAYAYRSELVKRQSVYDAGSELYDKLAKEIASLDSDIYTLLEDNEKLKDFIWEIRFTDPLDEVINGLDETISSTKNLRSLLNDDAFFENSGLLSEDGAAYLALLNQEMSASKQKIAEYTTALHKLDEAYQNGTISPKEYAESQADFLKEIQDAAGDVQDYKEDIINLYKDQLKAEMDYMDEYYEKRSDALALDKEYYEFSKKVQSQSKSINQLKAQIAALSGTNNASAQAELRRLQAELAEEEASMEELKRNRAYDMQTDGYSALSDKMENVYDSALEELTANAGKQEQVVSDMLGNIIKMYDQAYGKIQQIIANTGFIGNSGFQSNQSALGTASGASGQVTSGTASQESIAPSQTISGINTGAINPNQANASILEDIQNTPDIHNRPVAEITLSTTALSLVKGKSATLAASIRPTDAANKSLIWESTNISVATVSNGVVKGVGAGSATILCMASDGGGASATASVTVTVPPSASSSASSSASNKGTSSGQIPFTPKKDSYPKNKLNINSSIVDRLKYYDYDSSKSALRKLYEYWGGSGFYTGTAAQNSWLLRKMKSAGYKAGSRFIPNNGADFVHEGEIVIRKTDGGMLMPLKRGDGVIPSGLTDNLWELAEHTPQLLHNPGIQLTALTVPNVKSGSTDIQTQFHFDTLLNVEGNASESLVDELKAALPSLGKDLTRIVSAELSSDYRKLR